MSNNDDPFGRDGGDWGEPPKPLADDDQIDMNYGQPLPPPGGEQGPGGHPLPQPGYGAPPLDDRPEQGITRSPETGMAKPKLENDDVVALVVSAFLPGVGHMLLGQVPKGVVILIGSWVTCYGFGLVWIAMLIDTYLVALTRKYRTVGDWEFFPDSSKHLKS